MFAISKKDSNLLTKGKILFNVYTFCFDVFLCAVYTEIALNSPESRDEIIACQTNCCYTYYGVNSTCLDGEDLTNCVLGTYGSPTDCFGCSEQCSAFYPLSVVGACLAIVSLQSCYTTLIMPPTRMVLMVKVSATVMLDVSLFWEIFFNYSFQASVTSDIVLLVALIHLGIKSSVVLIRICRAFFREQETPPSILIFPCWLVWMVITFVFSSCLYFVVSTYVLFVSLIVGAVIMPIIFVDLIKRALNLKPLDWSILRSYHGLLQTITFSVIGKQVVEGEMDVEGLMTVIDFFKA